MTSPSETIPEGEEGEEEKDEKEQNSLPPLPPPAPAPAAEKTEAQAAAEAAAEAEAERRREEQELAKAIQRAETIVDSLEGVSVKVLQGTPSTTLYVHMSKYANFFDAAFVSTRALGTLGQEAFPKLLKAQALVAVETGKYFVPLSKKSKESLDDKMLEFVAINNAKEGNGTLKRLPHPSDVVPRRRRDERATDVVFFQKE